MLIQSRKKTSRNRCGARPIRNREITGAINSAISLRLRSEYLEMEMTLRFPKKIRLKDQRVYAAPRTLLVAAKSVAQKFCWKRPTKI